MSVKTILISQFPLPYEHIGSWTTMYNYYLLHHKHKIDYLICPKSNIKIGGGIKVLNSNLSLSDKVFKRISKQKYFNIFKILKKIIRLDKKYIIQIVDNHGLVLPLNEFLLKENIRNKCYLQFFYHGYPPFFDSYKGSFFFEALDEHVVLTNDCYSLYKKYYAVLPCLFNVLNNGVDSKKFYPIEKNDKLKFRTSNKVEKDNLIFIWCSRDVPKKGLDFILKVWSMLIEDVNNIELWIIGVNREIKGDKIKNIGKLPNESLPNYYQMADFYLFPTLCQEGFGLSLVEALKCGCYCIASSTGAIPEVLNHGEYGKLIENPNFIENWLSIIKESIDEFIYNNYENPFKVNIPVKLYDLNQWCLDMDNIINGAKKII